MQTVEQYAGQVIVGTGAAAADRHIEHPHHLGRRNICTQVAFALRVRAVGEFARARTLKLAGELAGSL
ncbi:hypothetical protein [Nocardia sp. NPDC019395]|uniref:hypothetical protein n=1 Tax=Nocardia sp. NPDC019395 TaxID=3154686 RepID=UPI0033DBBF6A